MLVIKGIVVMQKHLFGLQWLCFPAVTLCKSHKAGKQCIFWVWYQGRHLVQYKIAPAAASICFDKQGFVMTVVITAGSEESKESLRNLSKSPRINYPNISQGDSVCVIIIFNMELDESCWLCAWEWCLIWGSLVCLDVAKCGYRGIRLGLLKKTNSKL